MPKRGFQHFLKKEHLNGRDFSKYRAKSDWYTLQDESRRLKQNTAAVKRRKEVIYLKTRVGQGVP